MILPPNVSAVKDRHGKTRYRYRRKGVKGGYLTGKPWSKEWTAQLAEYASATPVQPAVKGRKVKNRSMDHLARELRASHRWKARAVSTNRTYGRDIDRLLNTTNKKGDRFGDRLVTDITVASLERHLGSLKANAQLRRKNLKRLFAFAKKLGWRDDNPAQETDPIKTTGTGFHAWTEEEIEQFRTHHPYGTMARLVLALALNSAARKCNIALIERDHIKNGRLEIAHAKGNNATSVQLTSETMQSIAALPTAPIKHLIVTSYGKPFTIAGLGNKMREWCNEAGLPHCTMHGIRKAVSRRLAEGGASNMQGRSITGQKEDATFAYYAESANRKVMADAVFDKINK